MSRPSLLPYLEQLVAGGRRMAVASWAVVATALRNCIDPTYGAAVQALSQQAVMELVTIATFYAMIAMFLVTFQVDVPVGPGPLVPGSVRTLGLAAFDRDRRKDTSLQILEIKVMRVTGDRWDLDRAGVHRDLSALLELG